MKGQIHLLCFEWPEIFTGETKDALCGKAIVQATLVFMWDDTVAGDALQLDSNRVCRYCQEALMLRKTAPGPDEPSISYVYGVLNGTEARDINQRMELQIA